MPAGGKRKRLRAEDFEWQVLAGPELEGWEPPRVAVPKGSTASIVAVWATVVKVGPFKEQALLVFFDEASPNGGCRRRSVVASRPKAWRLGRLRDLGAYIKHLAPNGDVEQLGDDLVEELVGFDRALADRDSGDGSEVPDCPARKAPRGPPLRAGVILEFIGLNDVFRDVSAAPNDPLSLDELERLLDTAYRLGREVREAEFPSDHARSKSAESSLKRTEEAEAWWPDGQAWAADLIRRYPDGWRKGRRLTVTALGNQMADDWSKRPFAPVGPEYVEGTDLGKRVLPQWAKTGDLKLKKSGG